MPVRKQDEPQALVPSPLPGSLETLAVVWAACFVVRLAGVFLVQGSMPGLVVPPDASTFYLPIARSLAAGSGFQVDGSHLEASHIAPLFPLWLSGLMRAGGPEVPLWLVGVGSAGLRAGGCVFLYLLARRYFGPRSAAAAAVLYVIDPWESLWVGMVLKESLAVPLLLGAVWLLVRMTDSRSAASAALAGAAIGLAALARFPNGALWIAAVLLALFAGRGRRRALSLGACVSLAMVATLSPWLARNWAVTGQPVLSTHFVGRKLYTSNGPGIQPVTDGYYDPEGIDPALIPRAGEEKGRTVQQEGQLARLTLSHLAAHPEELPARIAAKVVNMWQPTFREHSTRNTLLLGIPYCVLMLISLAGIFVAARRRLPCVGLAVPLAVFFCVHLLFWGEIRNRQYLMPLLYAFGGLAIATALDRVRGAPGPVADA